jgi:hypothetical protein
MLSNMQSCIISVQVFVITWKLWISVPKACNLSGTAAIKVLRCIGNYFPISYLVFIGANNNIINSSIANATFRDN